MLGAQVGPGGAQWMGGGKPKPPGQAMPIPAPSQGTPYGQPMKPAGLRAWNDPTNPVGPSYNPSAQPAVPFGTPPAYPAKRDMGGFIPVTPGSRPPADPYADVRDLMDQYPGVDPNELRRFREQVAARERDNAADRFRQDSAAVAPDYERRRRAANAASAASFADKQRAAYGQPLPGGQSQQSGGPYGTPSLIPIPQWPQNGGYGQPGEPDWYGSHGMGNDMFYLPGDPGAPQAMPLPQRPVGPDGRRYF